MNAVAYASRYHPEWFWRGAQHTEKWRAKIRHNLNRRHFLAALRVAHRICSRILLHRRKIAEHLLRFRQISRMLYTTSSPQLHHAHRQVFLQLRTANLAVMYSTLLAVFSLSIREPARTVRNFPPPRSSLLVMWRQVIKN